MLLKCNTATPLSFTFLTVGMHFAPKNSEVITMARVCIQLYMRSVYYIKTRIEIS